MKHKINDNTIRRIQLTGGSSYIVSLPKEWIYKQNLKKGSLVNLVQIEDSSLCIKPEGFDLVHPLKKAIIKIFSIDSPERVVRYLISSYIQGYNIIQIKSDEPRIDTDTKIAIKDIVRKKFVGTEILSETANEITLQVLLSYKDLSINDVLIRMSSMVTSMHKDINQAIRTGDTLVAKEVINMDDEVDRFSFYLIRLLTQATKNPKNLAEIGLDNSSNCLNYRIIVKAIERTADHAVNIAKNQLEMKNCIFDQEILRNLNSISESAIEIFDAAIKAVINKNYDEAENVLNVAKAIRKNSDETLLNLNQSEFVKNCPQLSLILESTIRTYEYGKDIAEMVLNMNINDVVYEN
ncbi:phosphate uptake regulator PhoU [Candidatus Bathyarchaeota archaeon]|nr:phosphate uptake regulator PhoU [Candidatus Bathyarchaeota archaeon]